MSSLSTSPSFTLRATQKSYRFAEFRDRLASVADLDQRFHTWLESEYHRSPHRGLKGATPLETWLAKCHSHRAAQSCRRLGRGVPSRGHPQGLPRLHRHPLTAVGRYATL